MSGLETWFDSVAETYLSALHLAALTRFPPRQANRAALRKVNEFFMMLH